MSGVELVGGVVVAFFTCGIVMGVLAVIALSATRRDRKRANRRRGFDRYDTDQTDAVGGGDPSAQSGPSRPTGPNWADRLGWEEPPGPDVDDANPPRWPGGYHGLIARG